MKVTKSRAVICAVAGALLTLSTGCANKQLSSSGPVFFPPAPNLPRLQYLTGFSDSIQVEGKSRDTVSFLSLGKEEEVRASRIIKPAGIASRNGKLYVADIAGQLFIIDLPKKKMEKLKGADGPGKSRKPVGITVDKAGFVFVSDIERKEILIYDDGGNYLKAIGGELDMTPTDVAVDGSLVYVLDTRKSIIRVLDPLTGEQVQEIGKLEDPTQSLSLPTKMSMDERGVLWVSNAGRGNITSYDRDGHYLGGFGKFGDGLGQFARPKGVVADENGYVYVVDSGFQNVQIFNDKGRLLGYFGSPKLPVGGMNLPCDITISNEDLPYYQTLAEKDFELSQVVFVANQFGNPKISLYGYGQRKGIDYDKVYREAALKQEKKAQELLKQRLKTEQPGKEAGTSAESK